MPPTPQKIFDKIRRGWYNAFVSDEIADKITTTTLPRSRKVELAVSIPLAMAIFFFGVIGVFGFCFWLYSLVPLTAPRGGFYLDFTSSNFENYADYSGFDIELYGDELRVLTITDFHFFGFPIFVDGRTERAITEMVERTQPQLIFVLGDNVSTLFTNHWAQNRFIRLMDSFEIPWIPLMGNHDARGRASEYWMVTQFYYSQYARFLWGANNLGVAGNFFVNITNEGVPVHTFFFLSSQESRAASSDYEPYTLEQIAWFEWASDGINARAGAIVPSTIMLHIPLPIFNNVWAYGYIISGTSSHEAYSAPHDNGFFEVIYARGATENIIAGHDHSNNAIAIYRGIRFASVPFITGNIAIFGAPGTNQGAMIITILPCGTLELEPIDR